MSIIALALVVTSASLHVFWNAVVKTCRDKVSFVFLTTCVGTLTAVPLFVGSRVLAPGPLNLAIVGLAAVSGLIEALYLMTLFAAYTKVDLSVAYPLSRGMAPLVALVPGVILLGDRLSWRQMCGVLLVSAGVAAVSLSAARAATDRRAVRNGILLAGLTGILIAGYHVVDRRALTLDKAPATLEYFFLMHLFLLGFVSLITMSVPGFRVRALAEWRGNRRGVVLVGVLSVLAYGLVMAALGLTNVTLVAATRNIGIVISTGVGGIALRERVGPERVAGSMLIVAGIIMLLLLGGPG